MMSTGSSTIISTNIFYLSILNENTTYVSFRNNKTIILNEVT